MSESTIFVEMYLDQGLIGGDHIDNIPQYEYVQK